MAKAKKTPAEIRQEEKDAERARLVAAAQANPFRFFTSGEVGMMFDFGGDTMTTLRSLGAPVVARAMHPGLLLKWIEQNADRIPKIRGEDE